MTTVEILALLRITFDDTIAPYLVSDLDCLHALSRAQNEFAAETLCIFDGTTTVNATQGDSFITLPEGTVWVKAAIWDGIPLGIVTQHELEYGYFTLNGVESSSRFTNWREKTGTPKFLINDLGALSARLVPTPTTTDTVTLERYCLPTELSLIQDPEIAVQYHRDLISGALAYMYGIQDADVYDAQKSLEFTVKWQSVLEGAKEQLQTELRRQERRLDLPDTVEFKQVKRSTNGLRPNSNT